MGWRRQQRQMSVLSAPRSHWPPSHETIAAACFPTKPHACEERDAPASRRCGAVDQQALHFAVTTSMEAYAKRGVPTCGRQPTTRAWHGGTCRVNCTLKLPLLQYFLERYAQVLFLDGMSSYPLCARSSAWCRVLRSAPSSGHPRPGMACVCQASCPSTSSRHRIPLVWRSHGQARAHL